MRAQTLTCHYKVSGSVKVLSRFSAAGIDPATVMIGRMVFRNMFRLGRRGSKRFVQAVSSVSSMRTLGNTLLLGFGINRITRDLSASEEGATLAFLCGAMTECFFKDNAADILRELARTLKASERLWGRSLL